MANLLPYVVSKQQLPCASIWAMVTHPTAHKLYIGSMFSYDPERKNLTVVDLSLDAADKQFQQSYPDTDIILSVGNRSWVAGLSYHKTLHKLYILTWEEDSKGASAGCYLSMYDMDATTGAIKSTVTTQKLAHKTAINRDDKIAVHPSLPLLYISEGSGVQIYPIDTQGRIGNAAPQSFDMTGIGGSLRDLTIHDNGKRLYAGTYDSHFVVATLDNQGFLAGSPRLLQDDHFPENFIWGSDGNDASLTRGFSFHYTAKAIYRRCPSIDGWLSYKRPDFPLRIWQLDSKGDPIGPKPQTVLNFNCDSESFFPTLNNLYCTETTFFNDAIDPAKKNVGAFVIKSYPLNAQGFPSATSTVLRTFDQEEPFAMQLNKKNNMPVVLTRSFHDLTVVRPKGMAQVSNQFLRCTITQSQPQIDNTWILWAKGSLRTLGGGDVLEPINNGSVIVSIDDIFQFTHQEFAAHQRVLLALELKNGAAKLQTCSWKLEYFDGHPNLGGVLLKTLQDTANGNKIHCLIDAYAYQSNSPQGRIERFELLSGQWKIWAAKAASVAVPAASRPKKFTLSAYQFLLKQAHQGQLSSMAQLVKSLGLNTMILEERPVFANLPTGTAQTVLQNAGIKQCSGAVYNPLSDGNVSVGLEYFEFYLATKDLNKWANLVAKDWYIYFGNKVVNFGIADEPGWHFERLVQILETNPLHPYQNLFLSHWRAFLIAEGLQPSDFNATIWENVHYLKQKPDFATATPVERKLYYWMMRYFQIAAIRGFDATKTALQKAFPTLKTTYANFNNFNNEWKSGNTYLVDWFEMGRMSAQLMWSETWIAGQVAWEWSYRMDLLSSAANASHGDDTKYLPIGVYVIGANLASHPASAMYEILTAVSRNAKTIDFYNLGNFNTSDPWVMNTGAYKPLTDGVKLLGKAEAFLFDALPKRGKVALFSVGSSTLWDDINNPCYTHDLKGIYLALMHEGYTIDFVDDKDIVSGFLSQRGYQILYVTAPNVSTAAAAEIDTWVLHGGTVVLSQGAGTHDQFNEATTVLDAVLGVTNRGHFRNEADFSGMPHQAVHHFSNAALPPVWISQLQPVTNTTATILHTLTSGETMVTQRNHGQGKAFFFNFLLGLQYFNARYDVPVDHPIPAVTKWREQYRSFALMPALAANVDKFVIIMSNHKMVEACVMESSAGLALVLFNWNNVTLTNLTIKVKTTKRYGQAVSAQGTTTQFGSSSIFVFQFNLSKLEYVDVIMIS